MDKILGIVSEYNPFHLGHLYHLNQSKKEVNPNYTIAVMSGNFTQRGDTAILDKWSRTEIALKNGVDLVVELPIFYSISSAENFALGAIKILNSLKLDTTLSFGSECGDINLLQNIADVLYKEPKEYVSILSHELALGKSFPKAREKALLMYLNDIRKYANILSGSNNILGIEYLKAMQSTKSNIHAITIKRVGSQYLDTNLNTNYPSATAIRTSIIEKKDVKNFLPASSYSILNSKIINQEVVLGLFVFEREILYKLRTMTISEISNLPDVSEGLENKIKKASDECNNLEELISMIKSKRYTLTRICRILLYALLGITKNDLESSYKVAPYIRVLGTNKKGKELISKIAKANPKLHIITSPKKFLDSSNNKVLKNMLNKEMLASNIYTLGYAYNSKANLDYTKKLIVE